MKLSHINVDALSNSELTNLLFSNTIDDGVVGDCIFVVGSEKAVEYRLPKALELFRVGRAQKILFSGGVSWREDGLTEAEHLKKEALLANIPEQCILIENQSAHTIENVLASLVVLNRAFYLQNVKRLLLVTNSFHMRRLHLVCQTYMPSWINYSLCAVYDNYTTIESWHTSPYSTQRVRQEAKKLVQLAKVGAILDLEIEI